MNIVTSGGNIPFNDLQSLHAEIAGELEEAWRSVTRRSAFVGGEFVERFEEDWARYCGARYAVGLSDGTAALEIALRGLGVGPGDEVIVPANTFVATWEAVVAVGARPTPVDVDADTLLMTAQAIEAACSPQTAAVVVVHLFGQTADMDAIAAVARRRGIFVVEDAAQAHGATWRGRRAGSMGDVGCFSFYPGKNLGAFGDAGGLVTNHSDVADYARTFSNHGRDPDAADRHLVVGDNRRLDGLQAAILSAKLPHLDRWNAARRRAVERYRDALADLPVRFIHAHPDAVSSHHLAVVEVAGRAGVRRQLQAEGISTGVHYAVPCHRQPAFSEFSSLALPVAEAAAQRILSLPLHPLLADHQIDRVAAALERALVSHRVPAKRAQIGYAPNLAEPALGGLRA